MSNKTYLIIDKSKLEEIYQDYHNKWNNSISQEDEWSGIGGTNAIEFIQEHSTEITLPTEEEIEKMAEEEYPLEDARKVLLHDNSGQYSRRKAYKKAFQTCIELLNKK